MKKLFVALTIISALALSFAFGATALADIAPYPSPGPKNLANPVVNQPIDNPNANSKDTGEGIVYAVVGGTVLGASLASGVALWLIKIRHVG